MSAMLESPAPPDLRSRVAAVWTWAGPPPTPAGAAAADVTVLPDGCMDLLFRCPAGNGRWSAGRGALVVTGPDPRPRAAAVEAGTGFVGIRFRPGMARAILDADPVIMLGASIPAGAVSGRLAALEQRLWDCRTPEEIAAGLLDGVRGLAGIEDGDRGGPARLPPPRVLAALDLLQAGSGDGIAGLAAALGVTERMLRRDLLAWTGLAPKALARILRFQSALSRLRGAADPLALLALDAGYADQAHMTREFRRLAGMPPSQARCRLLPVQIPPMSDPFKTGRGVPVQDEPRHHQARENPPCGSAM
jgi:AraC-like DNA-binding protein